MTRATQWAALVCMAWPACLPAANQDPWLRITSPNFELYTTAGERSGRDLIRHFEQVRSFFAQAFGGRLSAARPARIIAFRNEKEYQPYRPSEFAAAFYQPGPAHDFIVMSSAAGEHYPVAVHEFTHLMIHQSGMEVPPWLNEGLAELYSNLAPRGNKILVGQVIPGRLQVLRSDPWIPLATLLAVDHSSPYYNEKARAGMFYAESWALVHMLNLDPDYRPHLSAMALALKDGNPEAAFTKAYHKRIEVVEAALRTYFNSNTIRAELFNIQLAKSVEAPEIQTGAALPARLALAELLGSMRGRHEEAGAAYRQLASDFPASWEVEAGLADLAWQQRKLEDAATHFARAVELGCKDLQSLLLYARVLTYGRRDREAAAVLRKTAEFFPESSEVNLELGTTLVRTGNYGTAVVALVSVKKITTTEQAYQLYYNLAYAQYRLSDAPHARESIGKARGYTRNPEEIASLDRLQQAMDRSAIPVETPAAGVADAPAGVADDPGDVPRIVRRAAVEVPGKPEEPPVARPQVEGTLEDLECGKLARLHVRVDGAIRIFVIPDPSKVSLVSSSGEPVEMACGLQKPARALRIAYRELPQSGGIAGVVLTLEFK